MELSPLLFKEEPVEQKALEEALDLQVGMVKDVLRVRREAP